MVQSINQLPRLKSRPREAHKGLFGRLLLIAGSRGMSGAAVLCGLGALRSGAGLVRIASPAEVAPLIAMANPCYMTHYLDQDAAGRIGHDALPQLEESLRWASIVGVGPGLGQNQAIVELLQGLLQQHQSLVIDADGLNCLSSLIPSLSRRKYPTILTPHPGEFARLTGLSLDAIQANRQTVAIEFASRHHVVLVLKGPDTVVTDGERIYLNATGNPGMATGGCGDVLTGMVAALLGQGLPPFEATQLAVYLHGKAGDRAWNRLYQSPLLATDLIQELPAVLASVTGDGSTYR